MFLTGFCKIHKCANWQCFIFVTFNLLFLYYSALIICLVSNSPLLNFSVGYMFVKTPVASTMPSKMTIISNCCFLSCSGPSSQKGLLESMVC